jgi:hypothetical protein
MAFKQYTRCIEAADFGSKWRFVTIASLLAGTPAALIAVAMGDPACLWIVLAIYVAAAAVAYYHNWLYNRLICLGGDRSAVGAIVSIGGPVELGLNFLDRDTDYSINLLLKNTNYGPSQDGLSKAEIDGAHAALKVAAEQSLPYGELVRQHPSVTGIIPDIGGHFATDGKPGTNDGHTHQMAAVLHAEFEGDGNYKMLLASKILLAVAIYSLVGCLLGPFGWIFSLGILLFTLLGLFFASLLGGFGGGSPSDVNAGELTDNTGINDQGQGVGADIVYVEGSWVCDTLHERWNEIHPVKKCVKCGEGKWTGSWPSDDVILRLRNELQIADAEETIVNQAKPENQWVLHPAIDACTPQSPIT